MVENENEAALLGLRDALRSARRWRELLSDADRQALLADIARVGLAVARDLHGPVRDLDIGEAAVPVAACPAERLAFLQTVAPRVLSAVNRIEAEPPVALRVAERDVPMERARRVSAAALRGLARKPPAVFGKNRVSEAVFLPTHDTMPVRGAKTIVATFARDLTVITALAQEAQLTAVSAEAERLRVRMQTALRRPFWRDLPTLPRVPPLAPALRRSGAHVLLHDAYRRYRDGFAWDWSHPLIRLPARETWLLYEYWCLFAVVGCLRGAGFRASDEENFARTVPGGGVALTLATDAASRLHLRRGAETVTVTYQRRFDRGEDDTRGYHSRGQTLIPDITVEREGRLLILDAKFKTYAERGGGEAGPYLTALDDMRQLHSYRDAIRRGKEQAVRSAWALYPGRLTGANRPVIAFPDASPAKPFGNSDVGAILLRPGGAGADTLAALIEGTLRD